MTGRALHSRQSDLLHLSWLSARCAGRATAEIAAESGVSRSNVSNVTTNIQREDLKAIHSKEFPIKGDRLQAEITDHAAKYWRSRGGE